VHRATNAAVAEEKRCHCQKQFLANSFHARPCQQIIGRGYVVLLYVCKLLLTPLRVLVNGCRANELWTGSCLPTLTRHERVDAPAPALASAHARTCAFLRNTGKDRIRVRSLDLTCIRSGHYINLPFVPLLPRQSLANFPQNNISQKNLNRLLTSPTKRFPYPSRCLTTTTAAYVTLLVD
jgi:hypothetical protein